MSVSTLDRSRRSGVILMRQISMNHPLKYRGFSCYQSSYLASGPSETTVLSVRSDPGTPLVYAGFIIVVFGCAGLFWFRGAPARRGVRPAPRRVSTQSHS